MLCMAITGSAYSEIEWRSYVSPTPCSIAIIKCSSLHSPNTPNTHTTITQLHHILFPSPPILRNSTILKIQCKPHPTQTKKKNETEPNTDYDHSPLVSNHPPMTHPKSLQSNPYHLQLPFPEQFNSTMSGRTRRVTLIRRSPGRAGYGNRGDASRLYGRL